MLKILAMNFWQISLGLLCIYFLPKTEQCSPPEGWRPLKYEKRAEKANIVVFGTVVSRSGEEARFYTIRLHVHCVVKGPRLPAFIHVTGFSEFSGGLCVHSNALLNKMYVMFIKRDGNNSSRFRVLEVNLQKGAFHPGHKFSLLKDIMFFAGKNATLPIGVKSDSKPGCPDFSQRKFQDPVPHGLKSKKYCRCRKRNQRRKKRKRNKCMSWSRNKVKIKNITEVPTIPRTRRYSVIHFKQDKVAKEDMLPPSRGEKTLSNNSAGLHKLLPHWLWFLLTLPCLIMCLFPT